jgi:hypothetical protein
MHQNKYICPHCRSEKVSNSVTWQAKSQEPQDPSNHAVLQEMICQDCGHSFWMGLDQGIMTENPLRIDYTNYEGSRRVRSIRPLEVWFGVSPFHTGAQWFLRGYDLERCALRDFAMKDIHSMNP